MTFTIELTPEIEAAVLAQAQAKGLDATRYLQNLVSDQVATKASTDEEEFNPDSLSPEEWVREFKAWASSHDGLGLPILSDEAMSREFIYEDRGL